MPKTDKLAGTSNNTFELGLTKKVILRNNSGIIESKNNTSNYFPTVPHLSYIRGLGLTFSTTAIVQISPGVCASNDGTTFINTKNLLSINLGTSGYNGLDTGSEAASTWYYTWLIAGDGDKRSGTTSSSAASKLIDSTAKFTGDPAIIVNDIVVNMTNPLAPTWARVTAIDSATQLSLSVNIFTAASQVYAINPPIGLFSISNTSPTLTSLPTWYTKKRRLGSVRNNTLSNIISFRQFGYDNDREYIYTDPTSNTILNGGPVPTSWTTVAYGTFAPPTNYKLKVSLTVYRNGLGTTERIGMLRVAGDTTLALGQGYVYVSGAVNLVNDCAFFQLPTKGYTVTPNLEYMANAANTNLRIEVFGFSEVL